MPRTVNSFYSTQTHKALLDMALQTKDKEGPSHDYLSTHIQNSSLEISTLNHKSEQTVMASLANDRKAPPSEEAVVLPGWTRKEPSTTEPCRLHRTSCFRSDYIITKYERDELHEPAQCRVMLLNVACKQAL